MILSPRNFPECHPTDPRQCLQCVLGCDAGDERQRVACAEKAIPLMLDAFRAVEEYERAEERALK